MNIYTIAKNCIQIDINRFSFYLSFKTTVAFRDPETPDVIMACENVWGETTEKHIQAFTLGRKSIRIPRREFHFLADRSYQRAILKEAEDISFKALGFKQEEKNDHSKKCNADPVVDRANGIVTSG